MAQERLPELVAAFPENPGPVRKQIRDLLAMDICAFCAAAVPLVTPTADTPGAQFVSELLVANGLLPLCDPTLLSLEEEIRMARALMESDPLLDTKLARRFSSGGISEIAKIDGDVAERILAILAAISDGTRILPMLIQVLRHPDPRLRSKAALLLGRTNKNAQWVEKLLSEPDPRVRANVVESLWGVDSASARTVFWEAANDPNNRVVGNALLGLHRLGESASIPRILQMAAHVDPLFRASAAWVMKETGDPRFLPTLGLMVRETNSTTRRCVFDAIARIKRAASSAAEAPRLRVYLCRVKLLPDGTRIVHAVVAQQSGDAIPALPATRMVLWESSRMVADYSVQKIQPPEALAIGIVFPCRHMPPAATDERIEESIQACLALKRKADRWAVTRYLTEAGTRTAEAAAPAPATGEPKDADPQRKAICMLTADEEAVKKDALHPAYIRSGTFDAAEVLLRSVGSAPGNRHLIIVDDGMSETKPDEVQAASWQALIKQARLASVAIHAIAPPAPPRSALRFLAEVSHATGGAFLQEDLESIRASCERIYLSLLDCYEIRYSGEPLPGQPELRLQVYAQQGFGEDTLAAS